MITAMNTMRVIVLCCAWLLGSQAHAVSTEGDPAVLLSRADALKTSDHAQFMLLLESLAQRAHELLPAEQQYFQFLQAWQRVYSGDYEGAASMLSELLEQPVEPNLKFRAAGTLTNALALATRYEAAFSQLSQLLEVLPEIKSPDAREQLLGVAAFLYTQVGQYDLALNYAQQLIEENWSNRGACKGGEVRLEALYKSGRTPTGAEYQSAIDACTQIGEVVRANLIRTYVARMQLEQGEFHQALTLLNDNYAQAQSTRYGRLLAEYDALRAHAYHLAGDRAQARQLALRALTYAGSNEFTEATVLAYRLLYLLAREQGNFEVALAFHEKYAGADKGYLDAVSARQLAYERARNETIAARQQVDALNRQNQVLQLQRALGDKAVENSRLYIVLLFTVLIFIGLWAYRTKRSQLHFKRLSRHDAMTGIANRPYFIDSATRALADGHKNGRETCVVLCDLDHFKSINDLYGHATGDFVLKQVVAACQRLLHPQDIFGRLGGEEFGILLPDCSAEQGRLWSEQLRLAIAAIATHEARMTSSVSASMGLAATTGSGDELRDLLTRADAALYQAKRSGRNRTVVFDAAQVTSFAEGTAQHWARGFG
jgi:diguanylate cyclase (GGDEF)-like protein